MTAFFAKFTDKCKMDIMKLLIIILLMTSAIMTTDKLDTKYYIGRTLVDEALWRSLPDSMIRVREHWENGSTMVETIQLALQYKIDTVSEPGIKKVVMRSDADIASIRSQLAAVRSNGNELKLRAGEKAPQFNLIKHPGGAEVTDPLKPGNCYLINFWATWCGNCLRELRPDELPALAEEYIDNKHFVFMPICIDSTIEELQAFFDSDYGKAWPALRYMTYIDPERTANGEFAQPGIMPLTIVVGADGIISYIRTGRLTTESDYDALRQAIEAALPAEQ